MYADIKIGGIQMLKRIDAKVQGFVTCIGCGHTHGLTALYDNGDDQQLGGYCENCSNYCKYYKDSDRVLEYEIEIGTEHNSMHESKSLVGEITRGSHFDSSERVTQSEYHLEPHDMNESNEDLATEMFDKIIELDDITIENIEHVEPEDLINKPNHYHKNGIDVIGFAKKQFSREEQKGFFRINLLKYIVRYDKKGSPLADLNKAEVYLNELRALETDDNEN